MTMPETCPDTEISALTASLQSDSAGAMEEMHRLLGAFPKDPRLHFLHGSILASEGHHEAGHAAMTRAIELAPGYHLARFQLGLLELSSGQPAAAIATWQPLMSLPDGDYLKSFALGLGHLIQDEFENCRTLLEQGIASNEELPELNRDMQMVIKELPHAAMTEPVADISETQILLHGYSSTQTRH